MNFAEYAALHGLRDDFDAAIERANALMDELHDLASRGAEAGAISREEFEAFDPYAASDLVVELDDAAITAGGPTSALLRRARELVTQLERQVDAMHVRLGEGTGSRNQAIAIATLGAGLGALAIAGLLAYFTPQGRRVVRRARARTRRARRRGRR